MRRTGFLVFTVCAGLIASTVACGRLHNVNDGHVSVLSSASTSPLAAPSPTSTSTPTPTPSPTALRPAATTPDPIIVPDQPGCAGFQGKNLSASRVSSVLASAQRVEEWKGLGQSRVDPRMWPVPKVVVPLTMLKAIAYLESGWRTGCKGRDGIGFGLFQISADTEKFVNQRFGENFDRMTPSGNAALAVGYLEWIIVYLGLNHFGTNFDLNRNATFMDAVIESFQQGPDAVLVDGAITLNNADYVTAVRAMMISKPWL